MLLKLSVRNFLAGFRKGSWRKTDGKLDLSRMITVGFVALSVVYMAGLALYVEKLFFDATKLMGQPMLMLAFTLFIAMVMTLMLGLFTMISTLYFGKDNAWKAYLPVSSTSVLMAKWTEIYVGEVLVNLVIVAPAAVMYGLDIHGDVGYYVRALTVILATPLMPMVITTLLATLLMRISGLMRHKDAFIMIGSIALVVLILGLEMAIIPSMPEDMDATYIVQLLMGKESLVNLLLSAFPPLMWAARGIGGLWSEWALFVGLSVLLAAALLLMIGPGYMQICMQQTEQGKKERRARVRRTRDSRQHSPLRALFFREWSELCRTPVYAMNAFSSLLIMPVMMVAASIGMSSASEGEANILSMLGEMTQMLSPVMLVLIFTAILSLGCFINAATGTSVSREGQRLEISRLIPVDARTQLRAKLLVGMLINLAMQAILIVAVMILARQYSVYLIPAFVLATMVSYATSAASLTIDVVTPKLNWANETQAMKQNINTMFSMVLSMVLLALPVVAVVLVWRETDTVRMLAVSVVIAAETLAMWLLMRLYTERRYAALEG